MALIARLIIQHEVYTLLPREFELNFVLQCIEPATPIGDLNHDQRKVIAESRSTSSLLTAMNFDRIYSMSAASFQAADSFRQSNDPPSTLLSGCLWPPGIQRHTFTIPLEAEAKARRKMKSAHLRIARYFNFLPLRYRKWIRQNFEFLFFEIAQELAHDVSKNNFTVYLAVERCHIGLALPQPKRETPMLSHGEVLVLHFKVRGQDMFLSHVQRSS